MPIGPDRLRYVGRDHRDKLNGLGVAARRQQLDDVFDQLARLDFVVFQPESARLDLGKIENIADEGQERLARLTDGST